MQRHGLACAHYYFHTSYVSTVCGVYIIVSMYVGTSGRRRFVPIFLARSSVGVGNSNFVGKKKEKKSRKWGGKKRPAVVRWYWERKREREREREREEKYSRYLALLKPRKAAPASPSPSIQTGVYLSIRAVDGCCFCFAKERMLLLFSGNLMPQKVATKVELSRL